MFGEICCISAPFEGLEKFAAYQLHFEGLEQFAVYQLHLKVRSNLTCERNSSDQLHFQGFGTK